MSAPSIAPPEALRSGARRAARPPRRTLGWLRRRLRAAPLKHYELFDRSGRRIGTVPDAVPRPVVGANHPTIFIIRH